MTQELLEKYEENQAADLFRSDPAEHARRHEVGRRFFFGLHGGEKPDDPNWQKTLVQIVANSMVAPRPIENLSFRFSQDGDYWEINVGPSAMSDMGWAVDIEKLRAAFDRIDACGWYAVPAGQDRSPYCWIEGKFLDHEVFVRVQADTLPAAEIGK